MLRRIVPRLVGMGLGLGVLLGCVDLHVLTYGNPRESIGEAATEFSEDLRWGRLDRAAQRVLPTQRADFLMLFKSNDSFRFTGVEIAQVDYDAEKEEAVVTVHFSMYRPPSVQEFVLADAQRWYYDRSKAEWLVDPDLDRYERAGR